MAILLSVEIRAQPLRLMTGLRYKRTVTLKSNDVKSLKKIEVRSD
jgi:hypothetical protein